MSIAHATADTQARQVREVELNELIAMVQLTTVTMPGEEWVRRVTEGHRRWQAGIRGL